VGRGGMVVGLEARLGLIEVIDRTRALKVRTELKLSLAAPYGRGAQLPHLVRVCC